MIPAADPSKGGASTLIPLFLESSRVGPAPSWPRQSPWDVSLCHPLSPRVPRHSPARCPEGRGCPPSPSPGSAAGSAPAHPRSLWRPGGIRGQRGHPGTAGTTSGWGSTGQTPARAQGSSIALLLIPLSQTFLPGIQQLPPPRGFLEHPKASLPPGPHHCTPQIPLLPCTAGKGLSRAGCGTARGDSGTSCSCHGPWQAGKGSHTAHRHSHSCIQLGITNLGFWPSHQGRWGGGTYSSPGIPEGSSHCQGPPRSRGLATEWGWECRRSTREGLFWEPRRVPRVLLTTSSHSWI